MEIPTLITFARNNDLLFFEISLVFRLSSFVFLLYLHYDSIQTTVFKEDKCSVVSCISIALVNSVGGGKLYHPICRLVATIAYQCTIWTL